MNSHNPASLSPIPLDSLRPSPLNARTIDAAPVDELAASIRAEGLLQNLTVTPTEDGAYEVVAGERRRRALLLLRESGELPAELEAPYCLVVQNGRAMSASLAENSVREKMHPADEVAAFRRLVEQGKSIDDIAHEFGIRPLAVQRSLRLAHVHPDLFELFRHDQIRLDVMHALAVTDDADAQLRVWSGLNEWERAQPGIVKSRLTTAEINIAHDTVARYVGKDAIIAAGGNVRTDLFGGPEDGYTTDRQLIDSLALDKLEAAAEDVRREGWSWVEAAIEVPAEHLRKLDRIDPERGAVQLNMADAARLAELVAERDQIEAAEEAGESLDTDADRMEALDIEIEEIESRQHRWSPEQLAKAGAIATIGSGGALLIHRGLVRPNDAAALKPRRGAGASTVAGTKATSKPVEDLSARLTLRLSAHRTAILQGAVAARPHLALALLAFALLKDYCYRGTREWSILRLRAPELVPLEQHAGELASARHWIDRNDQLNAMQETLPPATELLGWLIAQPLERLTQLLADCIAMSVDTLLTSGDDGAERERTIKTVVAAAGIDFADYWQPTRATLLDHIPRGALEELVGELAGDLSLSRLSGLKKAEAAESAEQMVANSRWLPKLMRFASPRVPADNVTPTLKPNAKAKAPVNSNGSGARAGATKPAAKKGKAVGNSSKTPAKPKAAKAVKTATKPAAKKSAPPAAKKPAKKGGKA